MNAMKAACPATNAVAVAQGSEQMLSFEAFCAMRHFAGLDALRAVAVLLVLAYHCPPFHTPALAMVQSAGDVGVDVFFVLSGFLITTLLFREPSGSIGARLGRFYARRSLRIFPLYYLAIVVYGAKSMFVGEAEQWSQYVSFLPWLVTYCADIRLGMQSQPFPPMGIAWSLGVEEKFYLLWPLAVMCLSRANVLRLGVCVIAVSCAWRAWLAMHGDGTTAGRMYYAFDTRVDGIMWGCLAACVLAERRSFDVLRVAGSSPVIGWCAFLGLLLASASVSNASPGRYVLLPLLSTAWLVWVIVRAPGSGWSVMTWRPIAWIGVVSYGIYLFHQPAIALTRRLCGQETDLQVIVTCVLAAALSVCIASALYWFYERPFLQLKKRFAS